MCVVWERARALLRSTFTDCRTWCAGEIAIFFIPILDYFSLFEWQINEDNFHLKVGETNTAAHIQTQLTVLLAILFMWFRLSAHKLWLESRIKYYLHWEKNGSIACMRACVCVCIVASASWRYWWWPNNNNKNQRKKFIVFPIGCCFLSCLLQVWLVYILSCNFITHKCFDKWRQLQPMPSQ